MIFYKVKMLSSKSFDMMNSLMRRDYVFIFLKTDAENFMSTWF